MVRHRDEWVLASTLRDAAVLDFPITLLEGGCAAFDMATHQATIESLVEVSATVMSCAVLRRL